MFNSYNTIIRGLINKIAISELENLKKWCEEHKCSDEYDYIITYEPDENDASGSIDYLKDYIDERIKKLTK